MSAPAFGLTPGQFRAFLERPDVPPMRRRDACDCPLARALEAVRGRRCEIGGQFWNVDEEHGLLPVWAAEVVHRVDKVNGPLSAGADVPSAEVRAHFHQLFYGRGWCTCCGAANINVVSRAEPGEGPFCTRCWAHEGSMATCEHRPDSPALAPAERPPCHTCGACGEHEDGCADAEVES